MKTYDEKTQNFFRNTKVNSRFMHMVGGETDTVLEGQNKKMAFTHHQKFIIMDAPKIDGSDGRDNATRKKERQLEMIRSIDKDLDLCNYYSIISILEA